MLISALAVGVLVSLVLGYVARDDPYLLSVAVGVASMLAVPLATAFISLQRGFIRSTLLASTVFRRRWIRVSLSYLIAVPVDGQQLLVRGTRIPTQYQPVGGVFYRRSQAPGFRKIGTRPDPRFHPATSDSPDLRLLVRGRDLNQLLKWFRSRMEREIFPIREFYEEMVLPGFLSQQTFIYFDCAYRGIYSLPLRFDRYSQHHQLIVAEVYEMLPSSVQLEELRELKLKVQRGEVHDVLFVGEEQIVRGGAQDHSDASFDIPPTASWLTK